jgi:ATPase subunit of ABC transporter with duplicated ATPase domains
MRFYEFKPVKHIKPLSPPEARLHKLKDVRERNKAAIKTEKEAQKRQKALDKQRKQQGKVRPINNPNQTL